MSFLYYLTLSLFIFICVFLILLILIQKGRGGGLSGAFGGGGGGTTAFGTKTGDVLDLDDQHRVRHLHFAGSAVEHLYEQIAESIGGFYSASSHADGADYAGDPELIS